MAPQILRLGPPSSDPKIRPAGASGKGPSHKIGCASLLHRWIITTRPLLGAANFSFANDFFCKAVTITTPWNYPNVAPYSIPHSLPYTVYAVRVTWFLPEV